MDHCVLMHRGISLYYDGTDAYFMRQENDHYVYPYIRQSLFLNGCPTSTTIRE